MSTLLFLGTGTSSGIPMLGCDCATCTSHDPRDTRFRTSAYVVTDSGVKLLIDAGTDFRLQALTHQLHWIDGILVTHSHHDHIGGIDELRQINFVMQRHIELYGTAFALEEIRERFSYIFKETQKGGGKPQLNLIEVQAFQEFQINGQPILPLDVIHGQIPIFGYQIGGLSYITDASYLPPETLERIHRTPLLVINALHFTPHSTHFNLEQALEMIERIQPGAAYLVHMSHRVRHADVEQTLPSNVHLAYDNLVVEF